MFRSIVPKKMAIVEDKKVMSSAFNRPAYPQEDPLNISNITEKIAISELRLNKNQNLSESFTLNFKK